MKQKKRKTSILSKLTFEREKKVCSKKKKNLSHVVKPATLGEKFTDQKS